MTLWADKIISYKRGLNGFPRLPRGIEWLLPFQSAETERVMELFYKKFYNDDHARIFLFGINPGRFGAGLTGISFTDPIRLEYQCEIPNKFIPKPELSSEFIYEMIVQYGGVHKFYNTFYITSVCPLGLILNGKNFNYYDDREVLNTVRPFITRHLSDQVKMGGCREIAVCIGQGQNTSYLKKLNEEFGFFKKITALPHPRWVLQYRRKRKKEYLDMYIQVLSSVRSELAH